MLTSDRIEPASKCTEQLFILGAPRSGTTFLASLLGSTRFGKPVESHFITKYFLGLDNYGNLDNEANFNRLLTDILRERPIKQWRLILNSSQLHRELLERKGHIRYADLVESLFLARKKATNKKAWGDKTPHYLGDVDILDELFPKARYIYIVRDGRDVALSLLQKDWGPNNIYTAAEYWVRLNQSSDTLTRLASTGRLHFLRYEDLSQSLEHHIKEIGLFLGEVFSEDEVSRLANTVRKENSFKWKHSLPLHKVRLFESVGRETLARFGYETDKSQSSVPSYQRIFYRWHDKALWAVFMFKVNVIHGLQIRFFGREPFAD